MPIASLPRLAPTLALLTFLCGASPFFSSTAHAAPRAGSAPSGALAVLTVTTPTDEADGSCADGDCSLRDAVALAASGDTIDFAGALSGQTLTLTLGEITIDENLTIDGSSLPSPVTVSGGGTSRVFVVNAGVTVAITGLTITDGAAPGSGTDYETYGGAILNFGTLSLADCTVSNSDAPEADGGGIFSVGPLTVTRCTITGNHARFYGGGIALEGEATIRNSTISGNASQQGGGILSFVGPLHIDNSTLSGNTVDFAATGSAVMVEDGTVTIRNSTLFGTESRLLTVRTATLNMHNTLIYRPGPGASEPCFLVEATLGAHANNLIYGGTSSPLCQPEFTTDPNLGPLADHGGPTLTHLPAFPSDLIDNGDPTTCAALPGGDLDQRGEPRVGACDIGAVEFSGARPSGLVPTDGPTTGGTVVTITGTGFTGATGVTFGGVAGISFSVDSPTQITATTPAGSPGTVDVVVQHAGGEGALADGFTYVVPALSVGPVDGDGNPLPVPVAVPAGQTEVFYAGTIVNTTAGPLTIDGWPVITMPDLSQIVRRRPTVYTIPAGSSVDYSGAFNMLDTFEPGAYLFTYNLGDHPSVIQHTATFELVKSAPRVAGSARQGRNLPAMTSQPSDAVRAQAALAAKGDDGWMAVAAGEDAALQTERAAETPPATEAPLPVRTELGAAYPNPFNPTATVPFELAEAGAVRLVVYDLLGREVARLVDGRAEAGAHTAVFDASMLPSGTYLVRFEGGGRVQTQRLTLLK